MKMLVPNHFVCHFYYNFSVFYQRWIRDHGKPAGIRQYVQRLGHTGWCLWTDL